MSLAPPTPANLDALRGWLADNIRQRRKTLGLSQERLALEAGVDRTMLSKIERRLSNPSLETLVKLALPLGLDVSDLLARPAATGLLHPGYGPSTLHFAGVLSVQEPG